jgi:putative protease
MGLTYSRGFYPGWLHGVNHQTLVDGTFGAHRGVEIGLVKNIRAKSIIVATSELLKKGDGVLFAHSSNKGIKSEIGGKIYDLKKIRDGELELFFSKEFNIGLVQKDFKFYLNHDDTINKQLKKSYQDKNYQKKIPLNLSLTVKIGEKLALNVSDGINIVEVFSETLAEEAQKTPVAQEKIIEELSALSSTCFSVGSFSVDGDKKIFINLKELKVMRRAFSEELLKIRTSAKVIQIQKIEINKKQEWSRSSSQKINILLRDSHQVGSLINFLDEIKDVLGIIYLDFEFGKEFGPSVERLRNESVKVGIATTRILKPNEYHNFKIIERAKPDVILCRNLGAVQYFNKLHFELKGDFSFNVSNSLSAEYLLSKNLKTICASYDLSLKQLEDLLKNSPSGALEITVHQYMPSFHMEHCVYAAFLSKGTSFKDCGKPCEKYRVELKDQFGNFHQIKADQECRNTMYNSKAFSFIDKISNFKNFGANEFRFEALYENESELREKIISLKTLIQTPDSR